MRIKSVPFGVCFFYISVKRLIYGNGLTFCMYDSIIINVKLMRNND